MSKLTGKEPKHWHDADGKHPMKDPRTIGDGYPEQYWNADERAYVQHLEAHEAEMGNPQPADDDPPIVTAALALIASNEAQNAKLRMLISAFRQTQADGR